MATSQLTAEVARFLLSLRLTDDDCKRLHELSVKGGRGTLSEVEQQELEEYLAYGRMLDLWQMKARVALRHSMEHPE